VDLIRECLERERFLNEAWRKIKTSGDEVTRGIDLFALRLNNLVRVANESASQIQDIYLLLAKGKGNA
jgi:hypothetical protein